ncbi:hypothetical protein BJ944DRAFT_55163 [Cunninghamella echinulata]|nr:hypothetical protein BJ944DRAFT_55163 [Cunninghamella echinulata]
MDSEDKIKRLNNELLKIKKGLKDWEHNFYKKYQKKPTIDDIKERPRVEKVYKDYNTKKRQLRNINSHHQQQQHFDSQSQPLSYYDSFSQPQPLLQENMYLHSPTSSATSQSPTHHNQRRSSQASIEYIRSPSHKLSRIKYIEHQQLPSTTNPFNTNTKQSQKRKLDGHTTTANNDNENDNSNDNNNAERLKRLTDDASFWLTPSSTTTTSGHQESLSTTSSSFMNKLTLQNEDDEGKEKDIKDHHKESQATIDLLFSDSQSSSQQQNNNNNNNNNNSNSNNTQSSSLFSSDSNQLHKKKKKKKNIALEQKLFGHLIWKPRDTQNNNNELKIKENQDNATHVTLNNTKEEKENNRIIHSQQSTDELMHSSSTSTSPQSLSPTLISATTSMIIDNDNHNQHTDTSSSLSSSSSITTTIVNQHEKNNRITSTTTTTIMNNHREDGNILALENLIITERQLDPFRNYDPSLFAWDDPDFIVTPGLFSSVKARSTIMSPMMKDDPTRYRRVLDALNNGTLGEKRREEDEDGGLEDDLKQFISEYSTPLV